MQLSPDILLALEKAYHGRWEDTALYAELERLRLTESHSGYHAVSMAGIAKLFELRKAA